MSDPRHPHVPSPRIARPLRDADLATLRAAPNGPPTVRTDVRAGYSGSDFNAARRR